MAGPRYYMLSVTVQQEKPNSISQEPVSVEQPDLLLRHERMRSCMDSAHAQGEPIGKKL